MDLCPSAGKVEPPSAQAGVAPDLCEGLRALIKVTSTCAAEYPEDRRLQAHAADILELENKVKVDTKGLNMMRKMQSVPRPPQDKTDPALFARRIEMSEQLAAKNAADLAARRQAAAGAGYPQLLQEGYAQKIISNAVWRYLDNEMRAHPADCSTAAGRSAAQQFAGMLAVAGSHGNPFERVIIDRLLKSR